MTAPAPPLCGHRWRRGGWCHALQRTRHRCERPANHERDMLLRQPQQCWCRCGATTTRKGER